MQQLAETFSSLPFVEQDLPDAPSYRSLKISFLWFLGKVTVVQAIFKHSHRKGWRTTRGPASVWTPVPAIRSVAFQTRKCCGIPRTGIRPESSKPAKSA